MGDRNEIPIINTREIDEWYGYFEQMFREEDRYSNGECYYIVDTPIIKAEIFLSANYSKIGLQ